MQELYERLKSEFTKEYLEGVSVRLIEWFRGERRGEIRKLYRRVYSPEIHGEFQENPTREFFALIKSFHPDRLQSYRDKIEAYYSARDRNGLEALRLLVGLRLDDARPHTPPQSSPQSSPAPEYEAEAADVDFDSRAWAHDLNEDFDEFFDPQDEPDGDEADESDGAFGTDVEENRKEFLAALVLEEPGLKNEPLTESLLASLEGELNLSGYGIDDLTGLEFCTNLESLNLAGNCIESIDEIAKLRGLRRLYLSDNEIRDIAGLGELELLEELDLSFNPVEEISALLDLPALQLVNLVDCPLEPGQLERLKARGITAIH